MPRLVALCGGVGGAKLAYGLTRILPADDLTIIVNTGDDFEHLGLLICPDLDTVSYTLADREDFAQGWGRAQESHAVLDELGKLGGETWFSLGDKDIALHLLRRQWRDAGHRLTEITQRLTRRLGIGHSVLPVSDDPVRTILETDQGTLSFQDYFVHRRCAPRVAALRYEGAQKAQLTGEVLRSLRDPKLSGIVICPSNPYLSIDPMLAISGLREALATRTVPALAVSPIIGGRALKGPAAKLMSELGIPVTSLSVARHYGPLIDALVLDEEDRPVFEGHPNHTPALLVANTIMKNREDRVALAQQTLNLLDGLRAGA